MIFHYLTIHSI